MWFLDLTKTKISGHKKLFIVRYKHFYQKSLLKRFIVVAHKFNCCKNSVLGVKKYRKSIMAVIQEYEKLFYKDPYRKCEHEQQPEKGEVVGICAKRKKYCIFIIF